MNSPSIPLDRIRAAAAQAARAGGAIVRRDYARPRSITEKAPKDVVTETDLASQKAVLHIIEAAFPSHHILAEEDPASQPDENGVTVLPAGYCWMVDPVDGTANFATGVPFFCVSVGVALDGVALAGALYDPLREEFFEAARGEGAALNGVPLPPIQALPLREAIYGMDWAQAGQSPISVRGALGALAPQVRTTRVLGSAALGIAYTALGRLQLYLNLGIKPWDVAASTLIVQETGGVIRSPLGGPWSIGDPALIAGHPAVLEEAIPHLAARAGQ
jgi:myo-inositol-1(or 4)-monophosphatase